MEAFSVYKDMQSRTNGEIYIGVVGPVRHDPRGERVDRKSVV